MTPSRRPRFRPTLQGLEARLVQASLMPLNVAAPPALVGPFAATPATSSINQQVIAFAQSHLHQKVGGGECAQLISEALRVAGADFTAHDPSGNGDYVWGSLVTTITRGHDSASSARAQPGDIIQFQNVTMPGGWSAAQHTAIVAAVDSQGRPTMVYEQNVGINGKGKGAGAHDRTDRLDALTLNANTVLSGTVHIYRAVPRVDSPGKVQYSVVNNVNTPQTVTLYSNGKAFSSFRLDLFNTAASYQTGSVSSTGRVSFSIGINGHLVALNNASGYEVFTLPNGQASIRAI